MNIGRYIDPTRCWQLASGIAGIYLSYLVTGVLHEWMIKREYQDYESSEMGKFEWPAGFLIFPCGITYLIGSVINHYKIPQPYRVLIPHKNTAICGLTVSISTLTYTYAIYLTNFPIVMMIKSCNILSVILVGVCCSRVKEKKLKLGRKKIVVGVLITLAIIMFKYFDPEMAGKEEKKTQLLGIVLLIVSLLADGFLPDFQAQIKSVYKPQPMQMMVQINKWVSLISLLYSILLFQIFDLLTFIYRHHLFIAHMLTMSVLSTVGQMFVYRMIKQFKQHFAPFVITTRKIFTVGLSLFYFKHATNMYQLCGLLLVFLVVTYEFLSELVNEKKDQGHLPKNNSHGQLVVYKKQQQLNNSQIQVQQLSGYDQQNQTQISPLQNQKKHYQLRMTRQEMPSCCNPTALPQPITQHIQPTFLK